MSEASAAAQALVDEIANDFSEHAPCVGLLEPDGTVVVAMAAGYSHPLDVLRDAARVEGRPWVGVVVVADGTAKDPESGELLGRARTVTVTFAGAYWRHIALLPTGVINDTNQPAGDLAVAMAAAVRSPEEGLPPPS